MPTTSPDVTTEPTPDTEPVENEAALVDESQTVDTAGNVDGGTDSAVDVDSTTPDDSWRQPYEELGFEGIETPEQAQERLVEAYRRERESRAEAERQARYYQTVHSQLAKQDPQPEQQPEQQPGGMIDSITSKWVDISQTAIERYITKDESGKEVFTSDAPEEFRRQVMEYAERKQQWVDIISDPRHFAKAIDERLERMLSTRVDGVLTEREQQLADERAEQSFFSQNDWIFERDPVSGRITSTPSRQGKQFVESLRTAVSMGIPRKSDQLHAALAMYRAQQFEAAQAPINQRSTAQQVAQQQRDKLLGAKNAAPAKPTTAAGISDGPAAKPTNHNRMTIGQRLVTELQDEGYGLN